MHLDILCNENQPDALFMLNFFATQPLHVSGMFIAHHQEKLLYMYSSCYVYSEYLQMMGSKHAPNM
jgi:hypothetical protein